MLDIRQRTGYLFLAVMLAHVILISAQVQNRQGVKVLEAVTFGIFSEAQRLTAGGIGGARTVWSDYIALRGVQEENEALRRQIADLQVRLQQQRALAQESVGLREVLALKARVPLSTLAASVIAGEAMPGVPTVTIDKGSSDGAARDMAVIAPAGVVGRVFHDPLPRAARVQLLIGTDAAAGAMIERSRAGGVVIGMGPDQPLKMDLVSNLADVKVGDVVVTSGVDGIFPKGYPLGRVESAERGPGLYQVIKVRPSVDFSNLEEVLVVLTPPGKVPLEGPS
jgi:rod shape-determining protein MreC